ncbi:30301_t:CDS:2, partial [Racocetra persica]
KPNLTNDYKLIKLLEGYENDVPELKIVIHASIGLSINNKLQYDGKFNWKINRIIEEIKRAGQIESKTYVLYIGISNTDKDAREKLQIKLNLEEILRKIQETKVMVLLENSASNKCYKANMEELIQIKKSIKKELQHFKDKNGNKVPRVKLCFDTQYYFATGASRFIEDYEEVLDKYGKEIHLIYINNVIKERKFQHPSGAEHYQDPKEEKSQKRIREQKREQTLQITNEFLNKYRTEEQESQNEQFVKDLEELMVEITNIENEYEAIQRMSKDKLEEVYQQIQTIPTLPQEIKETQDNETPREKIYTFLNWHKEQQEPTKQYYKNKIAERERNYQYIYDDAIQIQLSQFVNIPMADKQLVMQQLIEESN